MTWYSSRRLWIVGGTTLLLFVVSIGVLVQWYLAGSQSKVIGVTTETEVAFTASVPETTPDRAGFIASMRERVVAYLATAEPEPAHVKSETNDETTATTSATTTDAVVEVDTCRSYYAYQNPWPSAELVQENREGARVYVIPTLQSDGVASEQLILSIPLRTWPNLSTTCIPTDVIGVALDGSLMRNGEMALYSVFGEETLLGYSLDGFPIYGVSERPTDMCGGSMVEGSYRYTLRADEETLIRCFAATPALLP